MEKFYYKVNLGIKFILESIMKYGSQYDSNVARRMAKLFMNLYSTIISPLDYDLTANVAKFFFIGISQNEAVDKLEFAMEDGIPAIAIFSYG